MSTSYSVLNELLSPVADCLNMNMEGARRLVELRAPDSVQEQIQVLAEKSNAGTLSSEERETYETYATASAFIAILQSKARKLLKDSEA
ncbi:MAG: hypothetical protein KDA65_19190 [Planctomycetaceae bacterium]|nr:hypothetical protein [Planctomycetaceae bacterium]